MQDRILGIIRESLQDPFVEYTAGSISLYDVISSGAVNSLYDLLDEEDSEPNRKII
jgi:hypothetical protein